MDERPGAIARLWVRRVREPALAAMRDGPVSEAELTERLWGSPPRLRRDAEQGQWARTCLLVLAEDDLIDLRQRSDGELVAVAL